MTIFVRATLMHKKYYLRQIEKAENVDNTREQQIVNKKEAAAAKNI